ncbi:MAG TPA: hypothetical protein VFV38_30985 [Ktedonobacteraceae bacterium]|nr:hypothetical protein [Ktedonobacteraceae bacterium]
MMQQGNKNTSIEQQNEMLDDSTLMEKRYNNVETPGSAPFATLTWQRWFEIHDHLLNHLNDFLQAMCDEQPRRALAFALDIQEVASKLLDEVYASLVAEELPSVSPIVTDTESRPGHTNGS